MESQRSYSYTCPATSPPRQHGIVHHTSSAFSASANPNEDWTKISDLAERRRIQNRIAQRNYRKKLKKRLEDLERRAGSSSASPEQKHEELDLSAITSSNHSSRSRRSEDGTDTSDIAQHSASQSNGYFAIGNSNTIPDDRSMFSQQHMRQLSLSPPPFTYANYSSVEAPASTQYASSASYSPRTFATADLQAYSNYLPPLSQGFPNKGLPVKQEYYGDDEMSPFSMSYASMAGVDISYGNGNSYREPMIHTPPLSDSYGESSAGSPPSYSMFPCTPMSMPMTPPLQVYER